MKFLMPLIVLVFLPTSILADQFTVTEVYDGDTIKVKGDGAEIKLRLAGIDAPEICRNKIVSGQPYSKEAREYLSDLIFDKAIEFSIHGYLNSDFVLGMVFLDGTNINLEMVRAGLAEVCRGGPPKNLNLDPFFKAESQSREAKKKMWAQGDEYMSPRVWRKRQRLRALCGIILFGICGKQR
jgi:micrococcal nuclease